MAAAVRLAEGEVRPVAAGEVRAAGAGLAVEAAVRAVEAAVRAARESVREAVLSLSLVLPYRRSIQPFL